MDVLAVVLVVWCVYVSDAVWWTSSDALLFTGTRLGEFRARRGPSLDVKDGRGLFASSLVPPFQCSFECQLTASVDTKARPLKCADIEHRVRQALELSTPPRRLGEGLWVFLFILAPVTVAWRGLSGTWMVLLAILIAWIVAIVVTYRRSWRALYADNASGWRGDAALMILSPPGAIRAADRLTRHALRHMSSVRVMSVVAPADQFCEVARLLYFEDPTPRQETITREIDQLLESPALGPMFAAPPTQEPGMMGFCRRCHVQLLRGTGDCPDCVGLAITPFEAESTLLPPV
jgi:hypothetical protein